MFRFLIVLFFSPTENDPIIPAGNTPDSQVDETLTVTEFCHVICDEDPSQSWCKMCNSVTGTKGLNRLSCISASLTSFMAPTAVLPGTNVV